MGKAVVKIDDTLVHWQLRFGLTPTAAILFGLTARLPAFISSAPIAPRQRRADPENKMMLIRLVADRRAIVFCGLVAGLFAAGGAGRAAEPFPFERELLLDVAPMPVAKRVPILMVESGGAATIDLWCRTVRGRVQINGNAIHIEAAPLPEALPQYMTPGQCTPERMQADSEMLAAFSQVSE